MANKKPTNKDRDQQIIYLARQMSQISNLLATYIEYKEDSADFQKHLIDLREKAKKEIKDDSENVNKSSDKNDSKAVQA